MTTLRLAALGFIFLLPAETMAGVFPGSFGTRLEPAVHQAQATGKRCWREPIWGFRISAFCKPTGICPDRVIKGYRTVCA